jgi:hypothetical protein
MPEESTSTIDLKGPGPFKLGFANSIPVMISSDQQFVGFQPEFLIQRDDKKETISIEFFVTAEEAMVLLKMLQEAQQKFGFPLASGPIETRTNQ